MDTWKEKNPGWEYILWDNEKVFSREWRNQEMIDHYLNLTTSDTFQIQTGAVLTGKRAKYFQWHVIADIILYEILYEYGGYLPGADSECLRSIDDKFGDEGIYLVNTGHLYGNRATRAESELLRKRYLPENCAPVTASIPHHPFLLKAIEELPKRPRGEAVDTTGNVFMGDLIRKYGVPTDARVVKYKLRANRVNPHSIHHAGTTTGSYSKLNQDDYDRQTKRKASNKRRENRSLPN